MKIHEKLGSWYEKEKREMPWRNSSDPYKIWLSEIILQQTRVAQGTDYYLRFLKKFPDIFFLANAETDEVLKIWQGLGYYSRARNLHETARHIVLERNGQFPDSYTDLLKLKGIGEYTAAAISSIAFNEPRAAVDGNVKRVISRLFALENEINSTEGKKIINSIAEEILDRNHPGHHNQAMMELGARICLPKKPVCLACPLNSICLALKDKKVAELPLKYKKSKVRDRFFNYLIIRKDENIWLQQRTAKDIWEGLYEFPLIETSGKIELIEFPGLIASYLNTDKKNVQITRISDPVIHKLSHRNIIGRFLHISFSGDLDISSLPGKKINISELDEYAVPKLIERYISINGN
jgi:A/G-specific adenine glycosylase